MNQALEDPSLQRNHHVRTGQDGEPHPHKPQRDHPRHGVPQKIGDGAICGNQRAANRIKANSMGSVGMYHPMESTQLTQVHRKWHEEQDHGQIAVCVCESPPRKQRLQARPKRKEVECPPRKGEEGSCIPLPTKPLSWWSCCAQAAVWACFKLSQASMPMNMAATATTEVIPR